MRMQIAQIADIQVGFPFRQQLQRSVKGVHVIQAKDLDTENGHRLDTSNLWHTEIEAGQDASRYQVCNGDVIFLSKGRRQSATLIEGLADGCKTIVPGYFFILRVACKAVLPEYLAWAINQPPAQKHLKSVATGSGMPFVPRPAFESLEIDVPAVEVQQKILALHKLAVREGQLLEQLRQKHSQLVRGICQIAAKHSNISE